MSMPKKNNVEDKKRKVDFTTNKSLNKYRKIDLFKDKVDKTNHILKTIFQLNFGNWLATPFYCSWSTVHLSPKRSKQPAIILHYLLPKLCILIY